MPPAADATTARRCAIASITERYSRLGYPVYRWHYREAAPEWTPLRKPLGESRLGVLSTAGGYVRGQVAYHYKDDTSLRAIPKATPRADLRFAPDCDAALAEFRSEPQPPRVRARLRPVRRHTRRDHVNARQRQQRLRRDPEVEMPGVNGVERAAEDADAPAHRAGTGASRGTGWSMLMSAALRCRAAGRASARIL